MKKACLILFLFTSQQMHAQNAKFISVMEKNLLIMKNAITQEEMLETASQFEKIATSEPKEWLPLYYTGWLYIMMSMQNKNNQLKDSCLDKALENISKAGKLSPENSEILALKSFALSMKIGVDPAGRGQKLGMESMITLEHAMKLDPENPRALLLKAQSVLYTPEKYGGGKEKAISVLELAIGKFKTVKPKNSLMPAWGAQRADEVLEQCKKMD